MEPCAIALSPQVRPLGIDGSLYVIDSEPFSILLNVTDVRVSSLNPAARSLLPSLLDDGLDATAKRLAARHRLKVGEVQRDLETFASQLKIQGVLPGTERERSVTRSIRRASFKVLAGLALCHKARSYISHHAEGRLCRRNKKELRPVVDNLLGWAWWSMRVLDWSSTLDLWKHKPAPNVVALSAQERREAVAVVDELVQEEAAAKLLLPCACKERALVAAYCLRQFGGLAADVIVGIIPVPFQVHAWSICEGRVLTDDAERIALFRPVIRFPMGSASS